MSLCCVGRWRLACFYSLCVSPCLFLFPPHPHRTLPSTQTLISQISEKVGLFHFLSIYSWPTDCARQLGPAGLVSSLRLAPAVPARQLASAHHCLGWLAGRTRDGWAGLLPCMPLLLESLMHCVSACPLSQAPLLEWPRMHDAWQKTAPHHCTQARLAVCTWSSSRAIVESCGSEGL